jgi:hypothetical protein
MGSSCKICRQIGLYVSEEIALTFVILELVLDKIFLAFTHRESLLGLLAKLRNECHVV